MTTKAQALHPYLEVQGPEGERYAVELVRERLTVGRLPNLNDVALDPDPQQLVTRQVHCVVEREGADHWVVDNGSVNGTFVRRGETLERVQGRAPLADGDVVCVLGRLTEAGDPVYWQLTFRDPLKTRPARIAPRPACLEYDWLQAKLFHVEGAARAEIKGLRPQEHKLVRYMAERNRTNGNVPVLCSYEELITAIWGEDAYHSQDEVIHLVWGLRKKIEPDQKEPRLLQLERGLGYRLNTCPRSMG